MTLEIKPMTATEIERRNADCLAKESKILESLFNEAVEYQIARAKIIADGLDNHRHDGIE